MSFVKADRVQEASTTTGSGDIALSGAYDGTYRTFASQMSNGDTCQVLIISETAVEWEIDEATYVSATNSVQRTTFVDSSTNAPVVFSSGRKRVAMLPIASTMLVETNDGDANVSRDFTVGRNLIVTGTLSVPIITPTISIASGGTGATTAVDATVNLNTAYSVENLAALKLLVSRPPIVVTGGYATVGDGGGGVWQWVSGSLTTANDGTVVTCTAGAPGRYKRIFSGMPNPLWFGADATGVATATTMFKAAIDLGLGMQITDGTYLIGQVNINPAATKIVGVGDVTINCTSSGGIVPFKFVGTGSAGGSIENMTINATLITGQAIKFESATYTVRNVTINLGAYNPQLPQAEPATFYGILVQGASGSGFTNFDHGIIENVTVNGGRTGIFIAGGNRLTLSGVNTYYQSRHGMLIGDGVSLTRVNIERHRGIGCGLYAFSLGIQDGSATTGAQLYPYQDIQMLDMYAENTGWTSYYTGIDGTLGAGKFGSDITTGGYRQMIFRGVARNCMQGGLETKYGNPTPVAIYPTGQHNADFDLKVFMDRDYGPGVLVTHGDTTSASTDETNIRITGSVTYTGAPAWQTATIYNLYDTVTSNSWVWLCVGDSNGVGGTSGANAPTGGTATQFTTSAATALGNPNLHFADGTDLSGVIPGQVIFAGSHLPDGTTVDSVSNVNPRTVVASANATGSGVPISQPVIFATSVNDGTGPSPKLNWRAVVADGYASPQIGAGVEIFSSQNVTCSMVTTHCSFGAVVSSQGSSDLLNTNTVLNGMVIRDSRIGVQVQGTGSISNLQLNGCSIEASLSALNFGAVTAAKTVEMFVMGGRMNSTAGDTITTNSGAGIINLSLDGGVRISSVADNVISLTSSGTTVVNIDADDVAFVGPGSTTVPLKLDGAGTTRFGRGAKIDNTSASTVAGWTTTGTMAVSGRVLRRDLTTTPVSGVSGTVAGIGEYMDLTVPTSTEHGYLCYGANNAWGRLGYSIFETYTLRLTAVDFNAGNTDNAVTIVLPAGFTRFTVYEVWISGASHDLTTATCGLFTATGAGGTAIVASGTPITVSTASENTLNNTQLLPLALSATQSFTDTTLFFRVQTAEGAAATANLLVVYAPLS